MSNETMNNDVMGGTLADELFGVTLKGVQMPDGKYAAKIAKIEKKVNDEGATRYSVEFKIANGDFEGKTVFYPYGGIHVGGPVTEAKIQKLMDEKGLDAEAAKAKAVENAATTHSSGMKSLKRLAAAAGYIDEKEATPSDKKRIENGTAWAMTSDFTLDKLIGRTVLITTKLGKPNSKGSSYQEVVRVEDADSIGDVAGTDLPF